MEKRILLLLFSFFSLTIYAQMVSPEVKTLASRITRGMSSDSMKVRAIYEWVTDNIAYDVDLFKYADFKQYAETQKPENVIKHRKAVCMGYTNLFQDLCVASGIRAYTITGYSKNLDSRTNALIFSTDRHSWNAVKVNNKWYLCDPTWSAGAINVRTGMFKKQLNEEFYLSEGRNFIKRHIPFDPLWQFSDAPVSMEEFRYGLRQARKPGFSYIDTLRVYEALDADQQKLNSDFRSLRFDASNDEAKTGIGYYYAKKAEIDSKVWHELVMSFMNKNNHDSYRRALEAKEQIYSLLGDIEKDMNKARYYYSMVLPGSQFGRMALNNMRNADNYLRFIEQNKDNLDKYYDAIKRVK